MKTDEKIIRAAARQFEAHGFSAATTKAIAEDAGVAEVTLFRCFGDKKTLFLKTAAYIAESLGLMSIAAAASGDIRQDIRSVCKGLLGHFIRFNGLIRMLIFEAKKHQDTFAILTGIRGKAMANMLALVTTYPEVAAACTQDSLEWLMSSLIGASLSYYMFHEKDDRDTFIAVQSQLIADAFVRQIQSEKV